MLFGCNHKKIKTIKSDTKRLTFTVMDKTEEYFVCKNCAKLPEFQNMDSVESIVCGDFKAH